MQTAQELQQAIHRHEAYAQADPGNLSLRLTLGDLYHRAGRLDDAGACYEHCLSQQPGHAIAQGRMALLHIAQQRFAQAEQALRPLVQANPTDAPLLHNLGVALFGQRRWDEASECLAQALEHGAATPAVFAYLTRSLHHVGRLDEAIAAATRWHELTRDGKSKSYLALLHMDNNDAQGSAQLAREVLADDPDDVDANVVAGMALARQQEVQPARLHFEAALRQDPGNGRAWLGLGIVQLYQQQHAQAIDALGQALRIFPDNPGIAVALGWARMMAKDAAGAQQAFEHAVRLNRSFSESHGGLASALAFQSQPEQARQEIKLARRLDPAGFGAEFAESTLLALQGQTQAATELIERLLQRAPREGMLPLIDLLRMHLAPGAEAAPPPRQALH